MQIIPEPGHVAVGRDGSPNSTVALRPRCEVIVCENEPADDERRLASLEFASDAVRA